MAKQGDLWDDSALVTAFNEAITTYKKMNVKKASDVSNETIIGDQSVCDVVNVENNKEAISPEDENEKVNLQLNTAKEVEEISDPSAIKETQCIESVEPYVSDSQAEVNVDWQKSDPNSQSSHDYNQLLNQYYELELQRQQIVNQLHQYGNWNYQYNDGTYNYATHWNNNSTTEASNAFTFPSICPCVGQCCSAPCSSAPTCSFAGPCAETCGPTGHMKSIITSEEDSDIVKTAMGAAERAISSLRTKITDDSNGANEEIENGIKLGTGIQSASLDTDLSVVLNAWYSAGFYTGKYLVEQSSADAKKHQS